MNLRSEGDGTPRRVTSHTPSNSGGGALIDEERRRHSCPPAYCR
jgi:hypothetical protein